MLCYVILHYSIVCYCIICYYIIVDYLSGDHHPDEGGEQVAAQPDLQPPEREAPVDREALPSHYYYII